MNRPLRILALEPYPARSHRLFLDGLRAHSRHRWTVEDLPPRWWKWRMRTAALHFAPLVQRRGCDLILASDYLNWAELRALLKEPPPAVLYFHENQLTYPLQEGEVRDVHFGLTHLYGILAARGALFNSAYHRDGFLDALEALLRQAPDVDLRAAVEEARSRSRVVPLGTDLPAGRPRTAGRPVILWAHRWEYDKDPEAFVGAMEALVAAGEDFAVRVLGERFRRRPPALERLGEVLGERLLSTDFAPDRGAYVRALDSAHITFSTARHEFFGLATLEAIRRGLLPVLPDDLAYPELVGADSPFLHSRAEGPVPALRRALDAVRRGRWMEPREALIRRSERFAWDRLAPRYDDLLSESAR